MGFFTGIVKIVLFGVNFLFVILGLAISIICGLLYGDIMKSTDGSSYHNEISGFTALLLIAIIFGVFVATVALCGCCGAFFNNRCLLYTYGSVMVILCLVSIGCAGALFFYSGSTVDDWSTGFYKDVMKSYGHDEEASKFIDAFDRSLSCCGSDSYRDWAQIEWSQNSNVPDSCCKEVKEDCGKGRLTNPNEEIYTTGCMKVIQDSSTTQAIILLVMAFAFLAMVFFSFCLGKKSAQNREFA